LERHLHHHFRVRKNQRQPLDQACLDFAMDPRGKRRLDQLAVVQFPNSIVWKREPIELFDG